MRLTQDSDLVIITAGIARKPGMSRDDLVRTNAGIIKSVCEKVKQHCPDAYVLILSNPVDAMTYEAFQSLGFPKNRVIGQSGVLDTARYFTFIAKELDVSVEDVHGAVLGGHGDDMVPLVRYTNVGGIPISKLLSRNGSMRSSSARESEAERSSACWGTVVLIMPPQLHSSAWRKRS